MKLYLDTTVNTKVTLRLDGKEYSVTYDTPQDQDVLGFLQKTLTQNNYSFKDISEIEVNRGPGSFTGTRVGVSIANALAFALNIKINNSEPPVLPKYSAPPSITSPKSGSKIPSRHRSASKSTSK